MYVLAEEKKLHVVSALVEGNSIRSIERMTGVHRDTIVRLLQRVGEGCERLLDDRMRRLDLRHLQCDEIWTYVGKKQKRLVPGDSPEFGDKFVFVALDADTKLVPCFLVGQRDADYTNLFMSKLRRCLNGHRVQITTDGFTLAFPRK